MQYLEKADSFSLKRVGKDDTFYYFQEGETYKFNVVGREYPPQNRTIHLRSATQNINFPKLQFSKYEVAGISRYAAITKFYFHTVTSDDFFPLMPHISGVNGICCLGPLTNDTYLTKNSLTLDEFISGFWLSRFVSSKINLQLFPYQQLFPNLFNSDPSLLVVGGFLRV